MPTFQNNSHNQTTGKPQFARIRGFFIFLKKFMYIYFVFIYMIYTLKRKIIDAKNQYIKHKNNVHGLLLVSAIIFMLTTMMNNRVNSELRNENEKLKIEKLKNDTKLQTMYYIVVRQGETIDRYKQAVIECQQSKTTWTPEKEKN